MKKITAFFIIIFIIIGNFFRKRIDHNSFNFISVLYYVAIATIGVLVFIKFKPINKNFWKWFGIYCFIAIGLIIYFSIS